jgi:hypothetical protein
MHDLASADQLRTGSGSEGRITYFKGGYGWAHISLEATKGPRFGAGTALGSPGCGWMQQNRT